MKRNKFYLNFLTRSSSFSQAPCYNWMVQSELPFLSPKWLQISKKYFESAIELEGICTNKTILNHLRHVESEMENENINHTIRKEFLVVGRSNVGKSTLINQLYNQKMAYTSRTPGKTRELYFYTLGGKRSGIVMVDAPGYGFAKGNQKELESWGMMINKYLDHGKYLYRVVCLIDAEHGLKNLDFMLFDLLEAKKKPFLVTLTKCDKINENKLQDLMKDVGEKVKKYNFCSTIINATSSNTGLGIIQLRAHIAYLLNMEGF